MSGQMTSRNEAIACLQLLQYDYADGVGDYGPVITEFSALLERYRKQFQEWQPQYTPEPEKLITQFVPMLKIAVIVAAAFLLVNLFFDSVLVMCAFYIAAGIALSCGAEDSSWTLKLLIFTLPFLLLAGPMDIKAYDSYAFWVVLVSYIFSAFGQKAKETQDAKTLEARRAAARDREQQHQQKKELMEANRQRLTLMAPRLREEFYTVREQMIQELGDVLTEEDRDLFNELPLLSWWDVPLGEMQAVEAKYKQSRIRGNVVWETRWVKRKYGEAFQNAGEEFSPLMPILGTEEQTPQLYNQLRNGICANGGTVLDFISRGTSYSMESETIYYEGYKHSDMTRLAGELGWYSLGNQIDKARLNGELTDRDYQYLKNEYVWGSILVNDAINEKVQKEAVEDRQVKSHTNIWTGQLLLLEDDAPDGGYAIMDYRCQPGHLFENLDALRDLKITRVMGDVCTRNPVVMAKLHRVCRECR